MSTVDTVTDQLQIGTHAFESRLIVGTGKYSSYQQMALALDLAGAECITVAVRRERLVDSAGNNILDFIDTGRYTLLPNTAGCFTADDAVRVAHMGREILLGLENPGAQAGAARHPALPDTSRGAVGWARGCNEVPLGRTV